VIGGDGFLGEFLAGDFGRWCCCCGFRHKF
jgi:hypothetical protein